VSFVSEGLDRILFCEKYIFGEQNIDRHSFMIVRMSSMHNLSTMLHHGRYENSIFIYHPDFRMMVCDRNTAGEDIKRIRFHIEGNISTHSCCDQIRTLKSYILILVFFIVSFFKIILSLGGRSCKRKYENIKAHAFCLLSVSERIFLGHSQTSTFDHYILWCIDHLSLC
jgi:hypothetical protein